MGAKVGTDGAFDDMNLTPLIDVVLVVLIIMMVSIPIQVQEMGIKVPDPRAGPLPKTDEPAPRDDALAPPVLARSAALRWRTSLGPAPAVARGARRDGLL